MRKPNDSNKNNYFVTIAAVIIIGGRLDLVTNFTNITARQNNKLAT